MKINGCMALTALVFYLNQVQAIPLTGQHSATIAGMDSPLAEEMGPAAKELAGTVSSLFVETFVDAAKGTAQGAAAGATYDQRLQK